MQYVTTDVLEHYGISCRNAEGNVLSVLCPFHDDHNPSGKIELLTGRFHCWSCNRHKTVLDYIAKLLDKPIRDIYYEVGKLDSTPSKYQTEDPGNVEEWHVTLWKTQSLLEELHKRCVSDEQIRLHRLGAFIPGEGTPAIRIPIRNKRGEVIAFKDYRPGATEKKFTWPLTGVSRRNAKEDRTHFFFPADQLAYSNLLLVGGEIKAIAASAVLNEHDIGAISGTGSESVEFDRVQLVAMQDKIVYICYDIDATGKDFALKLCRALRHYASEIHLVELPLDIQQYPHGDINDFLAAGGNLYELLQKTPVWEYEPPRFDDLEEEPPIDVSLSDAVSAGMAKKKVRLKTVISSMDIAPYAIPKDVRIVCDRRYRYCSVCKIHQNFSTEIADVKLSAERAELMEMVGGKTREQEFVLRKAFGIPARCSHVNFTPQTFYHVEDVRISQHLDIASRTNERSMQAAYCIGESKLNLEANESYVMTGRMYPHPDTQQSTLLITGIEAAQDALSTYVPQNLDKLTLFQPTEWTEQGIADKLADIYEDLSTNITRIYGRQDLHLLYDLAYHSVLLLPRNLKGWVEVLVAGDSAQGKTLCVDRLCNFYGLGERVVCKGATVPGLLGGVQQHGTRWFATWGKITLQDRRLIIMDEVKGMRTEVIAGLTDMRSSGIAEITKIEKRRANARTRLIMISNPRSELVVREHNSGVDVVKELIGSPEDIRRFDAIMIVAQKEVSDDVIHARDRPPYPHKYTAELCRELVLFGWTVPNVEFEDEFFISEAASKLTKEYVEDVPIIDSGTIREKLMRLATALAVRTFSTKDDKTVLVRRCHIEYICTFLRRMYANPAFGYLEYSKKKLSLEHIIKPELVRRRILLKVSHPQALVSAMLMAEDIDVNLIQDTLGWQTQDARDLLAFLNRHNALKRVAKSYRKTADFTRVLKEIERSGEGRPDHVPDEEF